MNQNSGPFKMSLTVIVMVALPCLMLIGMVQGIDHCSSHIIAKSFNSTFMQFTKEAVNRDYAVLGQFKSLHCCAKGYRSIEWFKNGKPYPWPEDVSSLILYPKAANQTVYTRQSTSADVGNYTCVLRNDTHKMEHHMELIVQGSSPDTPLATFKPYDQFIDLGESARFYCEAFVGNIGLPDVKSDISWYRIFDDNQEQKVDGIQEIIRREDEQIVGAYLSIPEITLNDYGRYLCRIEMGNPSHRLEMSAWLFGAPIEAKSNSIMVPIFLALCAATLTITLLFLCKCWWSAKNKKPHQCQVDPSEEFAIRGGGRV